jgi:hypothetical protein
VQVEAISKGSSWYNGVIREKRDEGSFYRADGTKATRDIHQPHDKGYKSLLSSKKVFLELLRSFVNAVERRRLADLRGARIGKK